MTIPWRNTTLRALAVLSLCGSALWGQNGDVAVIVNPKNPLGIVTMTALRKLFAGETRTWPGGTPVKLIVRAPGAHEREVVLRLLRFSEDEYARYWTTQAYRGEGVEPVAVFSNGIQKEAVLSIPGAIAMMDARDLKPGLKVLKIEGKLPGEAGYPLH
jgi:hypothetical protein